MNGWIGLLIACAGCASKSATVGGVPEGSTDAPAAVPAAAPAQSPGVVGERWPREGGRDFVERDGFVCSLQEFEEVHTLTVEPGRVRYEHRGEDAPERHTFEGLTFRWDGTGTGTILGEGIALSYDNHFGCIRDVQARWSVAGLERTHTFSSCRASEEACAQDDPQPATPPG